MYSVGRFSTVTYQHFISLCANQFWSAREIRGPFVFRHWSKTTKRVLEIKRRQKASVWINEEHVHAVREFVIGTLQMTIGLHLLCAAGSSLRSVLSSSESLWDFHRTKGRVVKKDSWHQKTDHEEVVTHEDASLQQQRQFHIFWNRSALTPMISLSTSLLGSLASLKDASELKFWSAKQKVRRVFNLISKSTFWRIKCVMT